MRILRRLLLLPALALAGDLAGQPAEPPAPGSVVVVANKAAEGSLRVARAYLQRRGIPESQLIVLETAATGQLSRQAYRDTVHNPLLLALLEKGLVNGIEGAPDALGRITVTVVDNPVRYVVLCHGVPSRISDQPAAEIDDLALRQGRFRGEQASLLNAFAEGPLAKNGASVDGELALLLQRGIPLTGFVPNPFYKNRTPGLVRDYLKVTRLDGPSPEAVIRMLDNALRGEREGLKGRAYVDEDGRGGGFQLGNDWLRNTVDVFKKLGFEMDHDTAGATFPASARMDAPVLYAGWYAANINGPFALPGFQFPPGAVAAHLHSFSAGNIRSTTSGWVGPFVERGVSATFGNVAEPYLRFTHQFDLFFAALANGWNFADAAYFALPGLSWQAVAIGDPLFRPFAVPLEVQLEGIGDPLRILADQYVVLRRIQILLNEDKADEALKVATRGMRASPGPALGLRRARLLEEAGRPADALRALAFLAQLEPSEASEWGLFADIADTLLRLGDSRSALRVYRFLEQQDMPEPAVIEFLKRGIAAASAAGEAGLAIDWQARVTPPPPPPPPPAPAGTAPAEAPPTSPQP